jgi:hypothetical protein
MTSINELSGPQLVEFYNARSGKPAIKKFRTRADGIARCKKLAPPPANRKNSRTKFGAGVVIEVIKTVNPRRSGTRAWATYEELLALAKKTDNKVVVSDLLEKTSYRRPDFEWDLEKGNIRKA